MKPSKLQILKALWRQWRQPSFSTRAQLEAYQASRIADHLSYMQKHTAYYRHSSTDLTALPILSKAEWMEAFTEMNTVGISREAAMQVAVQAENDRNFSPTINGITVGLSSGTTGKAGLFLVSPEDQARYIAAVFAKVLWPLKHLPTRIALIFRSNSNLYTALRSLVVEFEFFDLAEGTEAHRARLEDYAPHIIVAPPTYLRLLADDQACDLIKLQPDRVISVAEVLEADVRRDIEHAFGMVVHQLYQCTEGFLGSTCEYGTIHLHEDYIHVAPKWLDDKKRRFHPIITDFSRSTQAIIRYELNDILHLGDPCPCGSIHTPISHIEGRSDDVFTIDNVTIFPDTIRYAVIKSSSQVRDYVVTQVGENSITMALLLDSTEAHVDKDLVYDTVISALRTALSKQGVHHVQISGVPYHPPVADRKHRRVIKKIQEP